jgi:branched-chain amino acid transport system permease protein
MLPQLTANALIAAAGYTLVAVGFGLVFATTRFFHFAHGAVYTAGAYLALVFVKWLGLPLLAGAAAAIALCAGLGAVMEFVLYRPLRRRGATPLVLLLASLGAYIVLQNTISLVFGDQTQTLRSGVVRVGLPVLGARITPVQIWIIAVAVALTVLVWLLVKKTRLGISMRAVANDPELALISGVPADTVILASFVLGSALAGAAGILVAMDVDMTPTMGMNALMMGVVAVIVGGTGSVPGIALAALLLSAAQHFGVWQISSKWQDAIAFVILLVFLLFRPQGFFGRKVRKAEV